MNLFVHGIYDESTLKTLTGLGVDRLGFDLRGRSPNLIPFRSLTQMLATISIQKISLIFENDKETTILSFLNLLKDVPHPICLEFRDNLPADFYGNLKVPFQWMYHPEGDWQRILSLKNCTGILLPIKYQTHYAKLKELWQLTSERDLEVWLHADNFCETAGITLNKDVSISIDLGMEVECNFRTVDQDRLKKMKIWSHAE